AAARRPVPSRRHHIRQRGEHMPRRQLMDEQGQTAVEYALALLLVIALAGALAAIAAPGLFDDALDAIGAAL
ncbi:MAG TPA: hypothetical protein VLA98_04165, partial [Solirubrobacteraceae bacterium]|nr:hypothetical protein [Solirubrobacteraceae bacterium]